MWSDEIARRIFDSNKARHPISPRVFKERTPSDPISVDFKTDDNEELLSQLGHQDADDRSRRSTEKKKQQFYGWAILKTNLVSEEGRSLVEDRLHNNPFHALINLNISLNQDSEEIEKQWKHHVQELASQAFKFQPALPNE